MILNFCLVYLTIYFVGRVSRLVLESSRISNSVFGKQHKNVAWKCACNITILSFSLLDGSNNKTGRNCVLHYLSISISAVSVYPLKIWVYNLIT